MSNNCGNANWWCRAVSFFGWRVAIRVRRKEKRQKYRKWLDIKVFNYNYSEKAKQEINESNASLGKEVWPTEDEECHNCGQKMEVGRSD